jgi:hypothetical protein
MSRLEYPTAAFRLVLRYTYQNIAVAPFGYRSDVQSLYLTCDHAGSPNATIHRNWKRCESTIPS